MKGNCQNKTKKEMRAKEISEHGRSLAIITVK
jgi:hypothetical protein